MGGRNTARTGDDLFCRTAICSCIVLVLFAILATASPAAAGPVIYYSDYSAGTVYRTDGVTRSTLVTGLIQPMKIVIAGDGSFYVAMQSGTTPSGQAIRHFTAAGIPIGAAFATDAKHTGMTLGPDGKLYVSSTDTTFAHGYVDRYDLIANTPAPSAYTDHSPAQFTQFSPASYLEGLAFGPDGHLYASGNGHSAIDVYQGPTEASPGTLITSLVGAGHDYGVTFGPDGHLYASGFNDNIVYRYDGSSFLPFASTHLLNPVDPVFGPDDNLYVTNYNGRNITRYQGPLGASPGTFIDVFASQASGNPSYMAIAVPEPPSKLMAILAGVGFVFLRTRTPRHVALCFLTGVACCVAAASASAAGGIVIYYTQPFTDSVLRSDGTNTTTVVSGVTRASGIAFGRDGNLYVSNGGSNNIARFQGPNGSQPGAFISVFATTASRPSRLTVVPEPPADGLLILGLTPLAGICITRPSRRRA